MLHEGRLLDLPTAVFPEPRTEPDIQQALYKELLNEGMNSSIVSSQQSCEMGIIIPLVDMGKSKFTEPQPFWIFKSIFQTTR